MELNQKNLKTLKITVLSLCVFLIFLFLYLSVLVFKYHEGYVKDYEFRYSQLNTMEKGVVTAMDSTGEFESNIGSADLFSRKSNSESKGYNIFDDVANRHK